MVLLDEIVFSAKSFVESYGWFLLVGVVVCAFLWNKYKHRLCSTLSVNENEEEWQHKKFDDSEIVRRQEAMEVARRKLQEKYNAEATAEAEKQKQLAKQKLEDRLDDWEKHKEGKGYRNKPHSDVCARTTGSFSFKMHLPQMVQFRKTIRRRNLSEETIGILFHFLVGLVGFDQVEEEDSSEALGEDEAKRKT